MKQKIENFMTHSPHTINADLPLKLAKDMMKKYQVRHLPVLSTGHLVGIVSDRDLSLAIRLDQESKLLVKDVMTPDPYAVSIGTNLGDVVEEMATNKYGSTVIFGKNEKVAGIFTALDALRVISDALNTKNRKSMDPERLAI